MDAKLDVVAGAKDHKGWLNVGLWFRVQCGAHEHFTPERPRLTRGVEPRVRAVRGHKV